MEVDDKRNKYKEIGKSVKAFVVKEASLVADAKKISLDLKLAKEEHTIYVTSIEREVSHLREEFQMPK